MMKTRTNVTLKLATCATTMLVALSSLPLHTFAAESGSLNTWNSIYKAGNTTPECMTDVQACSIKISNSENPYDVDWNFGDNWNQYVKLCDWSLVFDADYYKKAFPMLALQYNYDDELLLKHFQTVGVHEGRQGCASFNVLAYLDNCDSSLAKAFSDRIECAYIYYMLNYADESGVNTKTYANGTKPDIQSEVYLTAVQSLELEKVNEYREAVGSAPIEISSELMALANYRAYINRVSGLNETTNSGHDWARKNSDTLLDYAAKVDSEMKSIAENTVTSQSSYVKRYYELYRGSKEHYDAMVNPKNDVLGVSNSYYYNGKASQFDMYINK